MYQTSAYTRHQIENLTKKTKGKKLQSNTPKFDYVFSSLLKQTDQRGMILLLVWHSRPYFHIVPFRELVIEIVPLRANTLVKLGKTGKPQTH